MELTKQCGFQSRIWRGMKQIAVFKWTTEKTRLRRFGNFTVLALSLLKNIGATEIIGKIQCILILKWACVCWRICLMKTVISQNWDRFVSSQGIDKDYRIFYKRYCIFAAASLNFKPVLKNYWYLSQKSWRVKWSNLLFSVLKNHATRQFVFRYISVCCIFAVCIGIFNRLWIHSGLPRLWSEWL